MIAETDLAKKLVSAPIWPNMHCHSTVTRRLGKYNGKGVTGAAFCEDSNILAVFNESTLGRSSRESLLPGVSGVLN